MNIPKKTFIIGLCIGATTLLHVYAAKIYVEVPKTASSNRAPLVLGVILDPEGKTVSGVSGELSFSSELFDVESIVTGGSVIPLWAESPKISNDNYLDRRTHIHFEGIIPGGFDGVRSAYTKNISGGILFSVILIPKASGRDIFLLHDIEIRNYDDRASLLSSSGSGSTIVVPALTNMTEKEPTSSNPKEKVESDSLSITVNQSDLIANGLTYLYVSEGNTSRAIDHIVVAETSEYDQTSVPSYKWRKVTNPYVLENQVRNKFIHIKVFYTDTTYTVAMIPPVENSPNTTQLSRILIGILVVVLLLLFYGKNKLYFFSKSHNS